MNHTTNPPTHQTPGERALQKAAALRRHHIAVEQAQCRAEELHELWRADPDAPASSRESAGIAWELALETSNATMRALLPFLNVGDEVTVPEGMDMIVVDSVVDANGMELVLTFDGLPADTSEWCRQPHRELVYAERWSPRGREFHGWISEEHRTLVQAG